jgi:hypothetical protein
MKTNIKVFGDISLQNISCGFTEQRARSLSDLTPPMTTGQSQGFSGPEAN